MLLKTEYQSSTTHASWFFNFVNHKTITNFKCKELFTMFVLVVKFGPHNSPFFLRGVVTTLVLKKSNSSIYNAWKSHL